MCLSHGAVPFAASFQMDWVSKLRLLFAKYLQRQCTPAEIEEMIVLMQRADAEAALSEEMELIWEDVKKDIGYNEVNWDHMYSSLADNEKRTDSLIQNAMATFYRPYYWIVASLFFCIIAIIFLLMKRSPAVATGKEVFKASHSYYLDTTGNDANSGTRERPFRTIEKLNSVELKPGDTVFFQAKQEFHGSIFLDSADRGDKRNPVVLTSSGQGKASIDGINGTALTIYQSSYITVSNLVFKGAGRKQGNTKDGVIINKCSRIVIDSIDVKGFQKAGLLVYSSSFIEIKRVYATENGAVGIFAGGEYGKRDCSDIHISYCTAENNPGDPTNFTNHSGNGILVGECRNILIEYCVATNNGWDMPRKGNGPVGIWCYEADSVIIQHCISYKNRTAPGAADGGGFDLDGGVTNSIIQYCLSYENEGSGFGIFQYAGASNWYNNTIRYCISENDGAVSPAHAGVFIWNSSMDTNQFRDCFFYNNVVYNEKAAAISYETQSANAGFRFYNNIFVGRDSLILGKETHSIYLGNNWYSLAEGFNANGIKSFSVWAAANGKEIYNGHIVGHNIFPSFFDPGKAAITSTSRLLQFTNYKLPDNSVLKTGGLNLKQLSGIETGGKSFNQTNAPQNGIGASF
ncbi:MAG: right-handed parallel beta-helix repeat-containing protein [Bacteroidetes bacterium]|nr:right-handed parallel beta-helix repeat-containing protein [Bacteroidota bacterium]